MERDNAFMLGVMVQARAYIVAGLRRRTDPAPASALELVRDLDRAVSQVLPATLHHDAGAYAQCSYCKRYSAQPETLYDQLNRVPFCDCGHRDGWSGSFKAPGPDAQWSLGICAVEEVRRGA